MNNKLHWILAVLLMIGTAGCGSIELGSLGVLGGGICTLIILVLQIIAIIEVAGSDRDLISKVLWILLIFFASVLGIIIYYVFGRR